jgi:hypothetical protein
MNAAKLDECLDIVMNNFTPAEIYPELIAIAIKMADDLYDINPDNQLSRDFDIAYQDAMNYVMTNSQQL